ncbi:hypothetical protein AgCh_014667 [Apium graveolens]
MCPQHLWTDNSTWVEEYVINGLSLLSLQTKLPAVAMCKVRVSVACKMFTILGACYAFTGATWASHMLETPY